MRSRIHAFARILNHPWRILGIVLAVVFAIEVGVMLVLPILLPDFVKEPFGAFIDATLLTAISAPVLWWIIIGPLRRIAIAEQIRSETIVSNAAEGIITTDRAGKVLSINQAAVDLFVCQSDEVIGQPLSMFVRDIEYRVTDVNQPVQYDGIRFSGDEFPAALSISQIPSESGPNFVVIIRDLTESRRSEEQRMVAAREKEALRAQQMATLAQLATGVAHEIRNPLTSVKMLIQTNRSQLQQDGLPSEDLELVEQEIRRMERSVNALLEYARPPASERKRTSLETVLERTRTLLEGRARSQDVDIQLSSKTRPVEVFTDPEQLQQLFLNLSLNALDAMPSGGTLRFEVNSLDGEALVEVTDSGTGIDANIIDDLFTPFVTSKKNGVGLGLGICRRIAEDHGGRLDGGNRPKGGASFALYLPLFNEVKNNQEVA